MTPKNKRAIYTVRTLHAVFAIFFIFLIGYLYYALIVGRLDWTVWAAVILLIVEGAAMALNGSGFGVLANHSLTMAAYLSRANAAIIDLRELLSQG